MLNVNNDGGLSILQQSQQRQNQRIEELASGQRINSAADGPAAQQVINRLTAEIEGDRQSVANAFDGISLAQVAESGLSNINEDVTRIRELTLQAGSGILSDSDRQALQTEISELQENITQTIEDTEFAGQSLFSEARTFGIQVGASADDRIDIETSDVLADLDDVLNIDVNTQSVEDALQATDTAIESLGESRNEFGAAQNRFDSTIRGLTQSGIDAAAARGRIGDTDFAQATSDLAAADILSRSSIAVQAQGNQQQGLVLSLLS